MDFALRSCDFFSSERVTLWLPLIEGLLFWLNIGPPFDDAMVFSSSSSWKTNGALCCLRSFIRLDIEADPVPMTDATADWGSHTRTEDFQIHRWPPKNRFYHVDIFFKEHHPWYNISQDQGFIIYFPQALWAVEDFQAWLLVQWSLSRLEAVKKTRNEPCRKPCPVSSLELQLAQPRK